MKKTKTVAGAAVLAVAFATLPAGAAFAGASSLTSTDTESTPAPRSADSAKKSIAKTPTAKKPAAKKPTKKSAKRKTLRLGSKGKQVKAAKQRLRQLGYFLPKVNSRFDQNMRQAVWALQKATGMKRSGTLNAKTWKALDRGKRPTSKKRSKKFTGIEINIKRQLLLVVRKGEVKTIFNTSTGRYGWRTVRGNFRVYRQVNGIRHAKLGLLYRPKYFHGGYAVHGEWWSVPAYPASHGCARVSNTAMNYIWKKNLMPKRSKVYVH